MKPAFKFDDSGAIPHSKGKLFTTEVKTKTGTPIQNGSEVRKPVSEKVGEDSLDGWVEKNIGEFEPTEGRL